MINGRQLNIFNVWLDCLSTEIVSSSLWTRSKCTTLLNIDH